MQPPSFCTRVTIITISKGRSEKDVYVLLVVGPQALDPNATCRKFFYRTLLLSPVI
jgi:hypothetical protein